MKPQVKHKATRVWPNSAWQTDYPFDAEAIASGEQRGNMETYGMWQTISKYEALAVEYVEDIEKKHFEAYSVEAIIHGARSLLKPKECGHELEGYVSIDGKRRRAFTSSALFVVNGKLLSVAILYVC